MPKRHLPSSISTSTSAELSSNKRHMSTSSTSFLSALPPLSSTYSPVSLPKHLHTRLVAFYLSVPLPDGMVVTDSRNRTVDTILNLSDYHLESLHDYIQWLFPLPEASPFNPWAPVVSKADSMAFRGTRELRSRLGLSFKRMLRFYGYEMKVRGGVRSLVTEEEEDGETGDETGDASNASAERENVEANGRVDTINITPLSDASGHDDPQREHKQDTSLNPTARIVIRPMGPHIFQKAARNWWCRFNHNHLRITRIIRCLRILGLELEAEAFYRALVETKEIYSGGPGETSYMFWRRAARRPLEISPENEDWDDAKDHTGVVNVEDGEGHD